MSVRWHRSWLFDGSGELVRCVEGIGYNCREVLDLGVECLTEQRDRRVAEFAGGDDPVEPGGRRCW